MRIPRDLSGQDMIKALAEFGYERTRQTGSHIRMTTLQNGVHHVTIPNHDPLRIGTLSSILQDVSTHLGISRDELLRRCR